LRFATKPLEAPPGVFDNYEASVQVAAVKCFDTEDASGEDEPYLVASVISAIPNFKGEDELLTTHIMSAESVRGDDTYSMGQRADDQIGGEKVLSIKASKLVELAIDPSEPGSLDKFKRSLLTTSELGPDIEFNFPTDHQDRRWLFEGGGGSYKVYLKVTVLNI